MADVLLCSEEPILAEGLARIFSTEQSFSLLSYCSRMEDLRIEVQRLQPDILLMDLCPGVTFDFLQGLHQVATHTRIVLWVHTISTELALQSMSPGVRGVLRKTLPVETLLNCLSRVHEGEIWLEQSLTDSFLSARRYSLTRREGQLVSLLSKGLKNREIATALEISEGTVKVYMSRLFQKLGVKDRFELALYGLRNLSPSPARPTDRPTTTPGDGPQSFFVEQMSPRRPQDMQRRGSLLLKN